MSPLGPPDDERAPSSSPFPNSLCPLSPKQLEVVRAMAEKRAIKPAAELIHLSPDTVKTHLEKAKMQLAAAGWVQPHSTWELVDLCREEGWLGDRPPPSHAILADAPAGSLVLVRARVRRWRDNPHFTDLVVERTDGSGDSGPGTARIFRHREVVVQVLEPPSSPSPTPAQL